MSFANPEDIAKYAIKKGKAKAEMPLSTLLPLAFVAGAFISLGFLLCIRVSGNLPSHWGSFGTFLGASVFPIGLILTMVAGGELLTGNMMTVPLAWLNGEIKLSQVFRNWLWVTVGNFLGAIFVAYAFGHIVGLTESGPFLAKTVDLAHHKVAEAFLPAFISGIGCNWLVALAVWVSYGSHNLSGKILGIWFPTMTFVALGFQHVVANMFLIPAAIFAGHGDWASYFMNFVPVYLGNAVGGAVFVGGIYWFVYVRKSNETVKAEVKTTESLTVEFSK